MLINKKYNDSHYLERYQEGQHKEVWDELVQLGPAVFEDQLYAEALSVARTMMRRVRSNIEILIAKLLQCGFVFGYDFRLLVQLERSLTSAQNRRLYMEMCNLAHEQPPVFLSAHQQEEEIAETQKLIEQDGSFPLFFEEGLDNETHLRQNKSYIDELEQIVGPVPLAVRAWFEEIAAVNFYGHHPQWNQFVPSPHQEHLSNQIRPDFLMSYCDPFQVCLLNEQKMMVLKEMYTKNKSCIFEIAPDHDFKDLYAGTSTPYCFALPYANADVIMPTYYSSTTFVDYLRLSLTWAGFPGMIKWQDIPRDELDFLTSGLLPF